MSCILYNKASYMHLAQSQIFHNACEKVLGKLLTQDQIASWLFALNYEAYAYRYKENVDVVECVEAFDAEPDYKFSETLASDDDFENPDRVCDVARSAVYQCSEFPETHPKAIEVEAFRAIIEAVRNSEDAKERQARLQAEQAAKLAKMREEEAQALIELRAAYPWAVPASAKMSNAARVAKNMRKELAIKFPGTKFSVKSDRNSIRVVWFDGASTEAVDAVCGQYEGGRFDGMDDCYHDDHSPEKSAWRSLLGCVDYVFTTRQFTRECLETVAAWYEFSSGHALAIKSCSDGESYFDITDRSQHFALFDMLKTTDFSVEGVR